MADKFPKPQNLANISFGLSGKGWMDTPAVLRKGLYCHPAKPQVLEALDLPSSKPWSPEDADWALPENWVRILSDGLRDRLERFRSLRIFMDVCVRCGACADKCHYFIGSGDPKNMPVLRAELLRSVYRRDYTLAGKIFGRFAGAQKLTPQVLKQWWYYFFQCSECRRCSIFCPYGIDTAEITIIGRELLSLLGKSTDWIATPTLNCLRTGNHLGIQPHAYKDMLAFFTDEIEEITGVRVHPSLNRKGAEILFVTPSGDVFSDPGTYTAMGYLILFHYLESLGLDITWSTYASEGGNFGFFFSHEMMKRLNAKIYEEAKRLKVKWILGGECGHMWRVIHQYMDTMNGPADFLEEPVSPITGTRFENARMAKMVHIAEFTADLIQNNKLKVDKSRNDHLIITFHDSCNTSRGMGLLEEPRHVIRGVCNNFFEMPESCIREKTFCCGSGGGLNAGENMELRLRGGLPRANAVKHVHEKHGVNMVATICAIDRAALPPLLDYWVPGVNVTGLHEMVGNALILEGEKKRTTDLRSQPLEGMEAVDENL